MQYVTVSVYELIKEKHTTLHVLLSSNNYTNLASIQTEKRRETLPELLLYLRSISLTLVILLLFIVLMIIKGTTKQYFISDLFIDDV